MKVICPAARGNGAFVLHQRLQRAIRGYSLHAYSPLWELFPPAITWFSRGRADLIHAPAEYGVFSRRRDIPQVLTLHGYNLDTAFRPYATTLQRAHYSTDLRLFMKHSLSRATAVAVVSRFTADLAMADLGIHRECRVIPNGVDVERFYPPRTRGNRNEVRVLFCGNMTRRKGAHLLPGIVERLDSRIRVVCATGLRGGSLPVERVEVLGSVRPEDMPALYRNVDILLMPSFREGMSLALLEAMASGLPVVASDAASFPEVVVEGKGGYLCPPGDVAAFAERITWLAENAPARAAMGAFNRARVEMHHDERDMVAAYRALFEETRDDAFS